MVVNLPAAVGDGIHKGRAVFHVVLGQHIVAHIAAAFALAGQEADPFQIPVFRAVIAVILHMIPHAESNLEQLVAHFLGVADAVLHAAQFYPVEVGVDGVQIVGLVVHRVVVREIIGPGRRRVGDGMVGLTALDQDAHAHGVVIRLLQTELLIIFALGFAAHLVFSAGQRGQDAVARAVHKDLGVHFMPLVGGQLEAAHALNAAAIHGGVAAGAVEQQLDVGLKANHFVQQRIPGGKVAAGIAMHVFQLQFFHDTRFLQIAHAGARAADPHADFAAGVAAKHRAILHQNHLRAVARRGNGGKHAADAAAYHADISIVNNRRQGRAHILYPPVL